MNKYARKRIHKYKMKQRFLYKFGPDCHPKYSCRYWLDYSLSPQRKSAKRSTNRRLRHIYNPFFLHDENHPCAMRGGEYRRAYDYERSGIS